MNFLLDNFQKDHLIFFAREETIEEKFQLEWCFKKAILWKSKLVFLLNNDAQDNFIELHLL